MKKKIESDPVVAFPDENSKPGDNDVLPALGRGAAVAEEILGRVCAAHPDIFSEWKFHSRSGWFQVYCLKKRRLFYLAPKRGDFRLSLVLGDKAINALSAGPSARRLKRLLQSAKRYPEGTAFTFDRESCDAETLQALLESKIAH